jgi:hypothetical protein
MLSVGLEPKLFVSEEYCQDTLTRLATSGYSEQPPFRNIYSWTQS